MEGVKQMNVVVVRGLVQKIGISKRDPYAMEIDRGRNCYICGGFGHMVHYCRNWGRRRVVEERRVEYKEKRIKGNIKQIEHLKEVENLEALN